MPETYTFARRPPEQEFAAIERQCRTSVDTILGRSTADGRALEEIPCTSFGRSLIDDANAAAGRSTLGLGTAAVEAYTEGTWTPGISFGNGTTGITYTTQVGRYVKVGKMVTVHALIELSAKGSSTGAARVTGLPSAVDANSYAVASLRLATVTFANQFTGFANNATTILLQEVTEAGALTDLDDTNFANTSSVMVTMTYRAA